MTRRLVLQRMPVGYAHRRRWDRDERGSVAPFVAISLLVLILMAAFAIDLGVQRIARKDMQALSDAVAVDAARVVDGRTRASIEAGSSTTGAMTPLGTVLDNSVRRNLDSALGTPSRCDGGGTRSAVADSCVRAYLVDIDDQTGTYPMAGGLPQQVAPGEVPDGVVITSMTTVDFNFSVVIGIGSGDATRSAVAGNIPSACFRLGSYAAAINTGNSTLLAPLNSLLGLNLSLVGYQGLANTSVSVAGLVATGLVGTADQFLTGNVTVRQLAQASVAVLQNQTPQNQAAITALNAIINASGSTGNIRVSDIINISPNDGAALNTAISVLDLVGGGLQIANGNSAVAINGLSVTAGSVLGVTANSIKVTERPGLTCGTINTAPSLATCANLTARPLPRGCAQNSQVQGDATIGLNLANLPVGSTFFKIGGVDANLNLNLGNGAGILSAPQPTCGAGTAASPDTQHVSLTTSLATASLTGGIHLETNALNLGALIGSVIVSVDITYNSQLPTPSAQGSINLTNPPNQITPVSGGSDVRLASLNTQPTVTLSVRPSGGGLPLVGALLATATGLLNTLFGITAATTTTAINSVVVPILNSLITSLNNALIGPLSTLLGLDVAGADVYMVGRPTCQAPQLIG